MAAYTLAVVSYLLTAVVITVDKVLLSQKVKKPFLYAFYVGLLNCLIFVLWPFDFSFLSFAITLVALFAGVSFFFALFFFYSAINKGEISRIVAFVGGTSPLVLFALSYFFLGERLPVFWFVGFVFLISGSLLLSFGKKQSVFLYSLASAIFFALTFFCTKVVFLETTFLNGFAWTRIGTLLVICVSMIFWRSFEIPQKKTSLVFFGNKVLGGFSFLLLNYAIMLGSVTIINALQGVQYIFIFALAFFVSFYHPGFIKESFSKKAILQKIFGVILISVGVVILFFPAGQTQAVGVKNFGVTFSKIQAEELGLDWRDVYLSIFEELKINKIRIPVYWSEVEPKEGQFDFSSIDWMLEVAEQHNAEIILVTGRKLPRWPECHQPEWLENYELRIRNQELLNYIRTTVKRYDEKGVVWAWQVENEPFLHFGECPNYDKYFVDEEIALVRTLSQKPVIITDGGEFGDWFRAYKRADIFGSTLYRTIFINKIGDWTNDRLGYITYPLPPSFFQIKRGLIELFYDKKPSIVVELQAEPWGPELLQNMELEEHYKSMDPEKFSKLMEYIKGTGFDTFYFWGVEWWYWLKEQGHPEMWELVKEAVDKV